jgi:hypothetical protein
MTSTTPDFPRLFETPKYVLRLELESSLLIKCIRVVSAAISAVTMHQPTPHDLMTGATQGYRMFSANTKPYVSVRRDAYLESYHVMAQRSVTTG